jgi:hypothetical protein
VFTSSAVNVELSATVVDESVVPKELEISTLNWIVVPVVPCQSTARLEDWTRWIFIYGELGREVSVRRSKPRVLGKGFPATTTLAGAPRP